MPRVSDLPSIAARLKAAGGESESLRFLLLRFPHTRENDSPSSLLSSESGSGVFKIDCSGWLFKVDGTTEVDFEASGGVEAEAQACRSELSASGNWGVT